MKKLFFYTVLLSFFTFYGQNIDLQVVAEGFSKPIGVTHAGDQRLFVTEQDGTIKIIDSNGQILGTSFLDISGRVRSGGERGLLGLAFHPDYENNGYFYVNYSDNSGDTVISRFQRSTNNENRADPSSELKMLEFDQPFSNHNGGHLDFGPDGMLYIASGDGGSGGDPRNLAQNNQSLLGKLLRLDVNKPAPYIPNDNPFVNTSGADQIWAYGLRNPWRFSFDALNGDLWIGDVGQNAFEEINRVSENPSGLNYGWPCFEGNDDYDSRTCPNNNADLIFPIADYNEPSSGNARSVTGGYVYRGSRFPTLQGIYIFGEFVTQQIGWITDNSGNITWSSVFNGVNFSSFGEDINNELYAVGYGGTIYRVVDSNIVLDTADFKNEKISIYPNPATDLITIKHKDQLKSIDIYSLTGSMVKHYSISPKGDNRDIFDISSLSAGLYMLNITDINQNQYNQSLVIE